MGFHDGLTTAGDADGSCAVVIGSIDTTKQESWLHDTCHILDLDSQVDICFGLDRVPHSNAELTSSKLGRRHFKLAFLEFSAHPLLSMHNLLPNIVEFLFKRIGLLFQVVEAFLGSGLIALEYLEGPKENTI